MISIFKNSVLITLLFIGLYSCTSEYHLDLPEYDQQVVCNSFFSPDKNWDVWIGKTTPFPSVDFNTEITDATVYVISENQDSILLKHDSNGHYKHHSKPIVNTNYQLLVITNTDTITSSHSQVPPKREFKVREFVENPGSILLNSYSITDVHEIACSVNHNNDVATYLQVRSFHADAENALNCFLIDQSIIDSMLTVETSYNWNKALTPISGDTIIGELELSYLLHLTVDTSYNNLYSTIEDLAFIGEFNQQELNIENYDICFSNAPNFESFQYTFDRLIGKFKEASQFTIYVPNYWKGEYWLQLSYFSKEAYDYNCSYVQQIEDRIDFPNQMTKVYSNMSNGIGIFAGVNTFDIFVTDTDTGNENGKFD